jgi:hypothetical protein
MHELGLAFDLWINDEDQLDDLGAVWEEMGGIWGGRFRDRIHFEAGGDNGQVFTPDAPDTLGAAPAGIVEGVSDTLGAFIPVLGQVSSLAKGAMQEFPSLQKSAFVKQISSPYHIFYDPLMVLKNWLF